MAKATLWSIPDAEVRKPGEQTGLYPGSPGCKRWVLSWGDSHILSAGANALSTPPGEYGRKAKTQKIDGGSHKRWRMLLNSKQREEPYLVLTSASTNLKGKGSRFSWKA